MFEVGGLGDLSHGFLCVWQVGTAEYPESLTRLFVPKHVTKSLSYTQPEPWVVIARSTSTVLVVA